MGRSLPRSRKTRTDRGDYAVNWDAPAACRAHQKKKAPGTNTPRPLQIWSSKGYKQPENLNDAIHVLQLNVPFDCMYSLVYQKVQSSLGSMAMLL